MEGWPSRRGATAQIASSAASVRFAEAAATRPRVIVLGNEMGGSGQSTTAMQVTVSLLQRGHKVGCMDLDVLARIEAEGTGCWDPASTARWSGSSASGARKLFSKGPTRLDLPRLDLRESGAGVRLNMSHRSCVT